MADEVKWTYASQVTLEANGASAASDAFVAADDADLTSTNHSDYLFADFVLNCDFGGTPTADTSEAINLYRRDLNIDGSNDAPAPATTYKRRYVGTFEVQGSASQYVFLEEVPLTQDCEFYIENKTDQSLSAGWTLKATPKTYVPGS